MTSPSTSGIGFKIKVLSNDHKCVILHRNSEADAPWVASKLSRMILNSPDIDINIMRKEIKDRYRINVHSLTLYRAHKWAFKIRGKEYEDSYNKLYSYIKQVYTINLGSYVVM